MVLNVAKAFVDLGLKDLGYIYVNINDYWKFNNCLTEQVYTNKGIKSPQYYPTMCDALLKTGKPILFSIRQWERDEVWSWA